MRTLTLEEMRVTGGGDALPDPSDPSYLDAVNALVDELLKHYWHMIQGAPDPTQAPPAVYGTIYVDPTANQIDLWGYMPPDITIPNIPPTIIEPPYWDPPYYDESGC